MFGFQALVLPRDLTREELPFVLRPFWAIPRLRDIDPSSPAFHRLLAACERLHGFAPADEQALLATLECALESGRLVMLGWQEVTFDPVLKGRGDTLALAPSAGHETSAFNLLLEQALHRRRAGARQQQAEPPAPASSRPLTFEESVAANNKFFGQPVSPVAPAKKTPAPALRPEPLVLHFEMDVHAPGTRNDRFTLRTQDGAWSKTIEMQSMNYVQDHWLELVFEEVPKEGLFDLIQHPSESGRTPFFVFRNLSYAELNEPAAEQAAVA